MESHSAFAIEIRDLWFSYPDGKQALQSVNLQIREGEKVALVGPNGAGKSTLLLHLNGILTGRGFIRINDLDVTDGQIKRIRALVGLVFQNPDDQLFSPTVFDDVAFGPTYMGMSQAEVRQSVRRALAQVGMSEYERRVSHHLSVGEKKRIAIATVLSMSPAILALDEPSSGLDPRARRTLINLLKALPQTALISTHDVRMVQDLCPRTIIMDAGRVVADGPTMSILGDDTLLEAHGLERP